MRIIYALLLFISAYQAQAAQVTLQFDQIKLYDLARVVYGDLLNRSYIFDADFIHATNDVSVNWVDQSNAQVLVMTNEIFKSHGYDLDSTGKVLHIRKTKQEDEDLLVYIPKNRSAKYLSDVVKNVSNFEPLGTRSMEAGQDFQNAISNQDELQGSASQQFNRSAKDQIAYNCLPVNCKRINNLLTQLDTPEAQVILRAAIYEVGTAQGEGGAVKLAASLLKTSLTAGSVLSGAAQLHLGTANLDVILSLLDQDSRFKVISRPMLRVKTGAQAKFTVGSQVPVLGNSSQDKNGNSVQSVEYRQAGTIFTVQPDIHQDVIDLNITQELSSFVATTTGVNNSPTLLQRTASSQLSVKAGEVVVFAGLEEQKNDETQSRFFGWSLEKKKSGSTSEVLLFIEATRI